MGQSIADSRLVDDDLRVRWVALQFLSECAYGDPQIVDLALMCWSPDGAE